MKLKIKLLFHTLFLLSVCQLSAQLDYNTRTKEKGETNAIILYNSKEVLKPSSLELDGNNGFKNAYKKILLDSMQSISRFSVHNNTIVIVTP